MQLDLNPNLPTAEAESATPSCVVRGPWPVLLRVALGGFLLLCLAVILVRWEFIYRIGDLFVVTGIEGPPIYSIWKVRHGHPLYEWPQDNCTFTLYNFLFYHCYAAILRIADVPDSSLILFSRGITTVFALLGAVLCYQLTLRLLGNSLPSRRDRLLLLGYLTILWLGPGSTVWWAYTVRPDVPAAVLALAGAMALVRAMDRDTLSWAVLASVLLFSAWAFKQSTVWIFTAGTLCLALARRWTLLAALVVPFLFGVAAALVFGSPEYRYNLLFVPTISSLRLRNGISRFAELVLPNLFVYVFAISALIRAFRNWRRGLPDSMRPVRWFFGAGVILGTLMGFAGLCRDGTSRNIMFEAFFLAAVLSTAELAHLLAPSNESAASAPGLGAWQPPLAAVLFLSMWLIPAFNLLVPHSAPGYIRSNLTYGDSHRYEVRKGFSEFMSHLPQPILIFDEILGQPWHSTGGRYPAVVIDHILYVQAEEHHLFEDGGLAGKIRRQEFPTVIASRSDPAGQAAADAGYVAVPVPSHLAVLPGASMGEFPVTVWVRPGEMEKGLVGFPTSAKPLD